MCISIMATVSLTASAAIAAGAADVVPFRTGDVFGKVSLLEGAAGKSGRCLWIEADRLYVAGRETLGVYDITASPSKPKLLGTLDGIANIRQVTVLDGIAYMTARANGLWIADCRNPEKPKLLGHYPSTANCTGVEIAGNVCIIGGSKSGLEFVDVSDPRRPQFIRREFLEPVESQSVAYCDGLLFSGEWRGRCVSVWDVRDMKSPKRLSLAGLSSNGDGVWVDGKWLYASTGFSRQDKNPGAKPHSGQMGLEIHDISDPARPKRVSRVDFEYCRPCSSDMWLVRTSGDRAFCTATVGGLYAVDISDKSNPKVLDRWLPSKRPCVSSLAVGNGVVYVTVFGRGAFAIVAKDAKISVTEKGAPPRNASFRPPVPECPAGFSRWLPSDTNLVANVTGLAVRGDTCYAAAGTAGMFVLSLTENGIEEKDRIPLAECMDVSIAGNRLFAAAGYEGWVMYEFEAGGKLRETARYRDPSARDVYAYGDGKRWATLNTIAHDITNFSSPRPIGRLVNQSRYNKFVTPDVIGGRWLAGNTALKYFNWIDLDAEKSGLSIVKGYKSGMGGICAFKDKAFISDNRKWAIVEPGSAEAPEMRDFPGGEKPLGLPRWNGGSLVSVSGGEQSASIWDFSDEDNPRLVRKLKLPGPADISAFWRDNIVIPARRHGVLLPKR